MILIADSGATKTDWILLDEKNKKIGQYRTIGFNPYFIDTTGVEKELKTKLLTSIKNEISQIFFYGAGCSTEQNCNIVSKALNNIFHNTEIEIHSDLLGAARALCGTNEGIACILGTGSNTCHYDGKNIIRKIVSLGYILGDEGSGAHLGKTFVKAYLADKLPDELKNKFYQKYKFSHKDILDSVYNKPFPNRFLASFSVFLFENIQHDFIKELIEKCFHEFFQTQVLIYPKYKKIPVNIVGSVGYAFAEILKNAAKEYKIQIQKICKTPVEGLIEFHTNQFSGG